MLLYLDSDAIYLVAPKTRSRVASYFYCVGAYTKNKIPLTNFNGPIHVECKILKYTVAAASETETAGLFHN